MLSKTVTNWLLDSEEPWVRWKTLAEIVGLPADDVQVKTAFRDIWKDKRVKAELRFCTDWPGPILKRHNTASHPLNRLELLVEFGLNSNLRGVKSLTKKLTAHRDTQTGLFESRIELPRVFGGSGEPEWCWMLCDAPVIVHALLAIGMTDDSKVMRAANHIESLVEENGWRCVSSFPKVRGPGKKTDPCPISTLLSLKALSLSEHHRKSLSCKLGTEMLLNHWECRGERRLHMFGIGTDFSKLRYPFIWYDILHVVDVLSRFTWTHNDSRFLEMIDVIRAKADGTGRYQAESVWRPYKDFDFGQKRSPSPTITLVVTRILKRLRHLAEIKLPLTLQKIRRHKPFHSRNSL